MNEWSIMLPLLAIALAIIGYRHLAKRQPEYPNGQVIGAFTLLGGGLGGLLIIVFAMVVDALRGHFDMPLFIVIPFIVGGSAIGCLPATLCGLILAWRRCTRSWKSAGLAALMGGVASVTILALAVMFRPLLLESIDPLFLRSVNGRGGLWHVAFLILVVMNLVAGFQALGTLMSVGLMMLPAIAARLWVKSIGALMLVSTVSALLCGYAGLLLSYHHPANLPSGPTIILFCGVWYLLSVLFGAQSGIVVKLLRKRHRAIHAAAK